MQLLPTNEVTNDLKWDLRHDAKGLLNIVLFEVEEGQSIYSHLRNNVSILFYFQIHHNIFQQKY